MAKTNNPKLTATGAGGGTKEHQIPFSDDMVRAILRGEKTQTRRVIKPQPEAQLSRLESGGLWTYTFCEREWRCPYGQSGDRLWVRESWCPLERCDWVGFNREDNINYKTDATPLGESIRKEMGYQWKSPIFMPRWASRIDLEITGVRGERVQEISEEDLRAEGTKLLDGHTLRESYECLWNYLNLKRGYGWKENPWVWVIEFKRIKP